MLIEIPDDEVGLLMYALGRLDYDKRESQDIRETADRLHQIIKAQIVKNEEIKERGKA